MYGMYINKYIYIILNIYVRNIMLANKAYSSTPKTDGNLLLFMAHNSTS